MQHSLVIRFHILELIALESFDIGYCCIFSIDLRNVCSCIIHILCIRAGSVFRCRPDFGLTAIASVNASTGNHQRVCIDGALFYNHISAGNIQVTAVRTCFSKCRIACRIFNGHFAAADFH